MTTENGTALAVREYPKIEAVTGFTSAQINLVRQTVAPGATVVELAWYLYNAKRLGLEPTLDQIYLIKYGNNPAEIVQGINGYRAQAESSGVYAGSDVALFEYEDVGQPKRAPSKATVTVWKIVQGQRVPFTAEARWTEFYPGDGKAGEQYRKRPHNQLSVRAESHALRKAFPYQTSRLDAHEPAPRAWIEAIQSAEDRHTDPARVALNAARYSEIHGSDDNDDHLTDTPAEAHQAIVAPPATPDGSMVTSKRSPLWAAWTAACAQAEAEGLETVELSLPVAADVLRASTATLVELVEEKRQAAPAAL